MINIESISKARMNETPYKWAFINNLFSTDHAKQLSKSYPKDHYKPVNGYDGEKSYVYECRSLIGMGATEASFAYKLDPSWIQFASDLMSQEYRNALSSLTGLDLMTVAMEANVFHYSPGTWMGPHVDLKDKIITHVFYFNEKWDDSQGGCLSILSSNDPKDVKFHVSPIVGNSAIIVRSNHSWHAVDRVHENCKTSRRSVTVTFYHPGAISSMWPPNETPALSEYVEKESYASNIMNMIKKRFPFK